MLCCIDVELLLKKEVVIVHFATLLLPLGSFVFYFYFFYFIL